MNVRKVIAHDCLRASIYELYGVMFLELPRLGASSNANQRPFAF